MDEEISNLSLISNMFKILIENNINPKIIKELKEIKEMNKRLKNLIDDLDRGGVDFCHNCYDYLENNFNSCGICSREECPKCIESQNMSNIIKVCVKCDIGICEKCNNINSDYINLNENGLYQCKFCVLYDI